jgi:hypothetical protein
MRKSCYFAAFSGAGAFSGTGAGFGCAAGCTGGVSILGASEANLFGVSAVELIICKFLVSLFCNGKCQSGLHTNTNDRSKTICAHNDFFSVDDD